MLSTLRNKIYNTLPDLNKAFLYNTISYDQVTAMESTLLTVQKVMTEKGIAPTDEFRDGRWLTINTNSTAHDSDFSNYTEETSVFNNDNPCKELVVLDGVDKGSNQSIKFIPTPYQDHPQQPQYMAIPFSKHFLYDIHRKDSVNVLRKYYAQSVRCLRSFNEKDVRRFKETLYAVIVDKLLPVIREDPHRVIPAYGGVLEILADISNSMKNANNTHQTPEEGLAYGLANVYFKKLIPSKNGPLKETLKDWVWGNNDESDTSNYYRSLLILLAVVLLLNGLCYAATLSFYLFIRRNADKNGSSSRSSKYSMWSRVKTTNGEQLISRGEQLTSCREQLIDCSCLKGVPFTSRNVKDACRINGNTQGMMIHHIQHIKCPHNVISPRPKNLYSSVPQTARTTTEKDNHNAGKEPCHDIPAGNHTHKFGRKMYQVKDFSIFKPLRCQDLKHRSARETEEAQSIQGTDEFQRIVRELDEAQRSLQHFQQMPRVAHYAKQYAKNQAGGNNGRGDTPRAMEREKDPLCPCVRPMSS